MSFDKPKVKGNSNNMYFTIIPENQETHYRRYWKINSNKKDFVKFSSKQICPYSKEEISRGSRANHPNHIALTGWCVHCGRLK